MKITNKKTGENVTGKIIEDIELTQQGKAPKNYPCPVIFETVAKNEETGQTLAKVFAYDLDELEAQHRKLKVYEQYNQNRKNEKY